MLAWIAISVLFIFKADLRKKKQTNNKNLNKPTHEKNQPHNQTAKYDHNIVLLKQN